MGSAGARSAGITLCKRAMVGEGASWQTGRMLTHEPATARVSIDGRQLVAEGRAIAMKGVNVGNWLNLESFMFGLPSVDHHIRACFAERLGPDAACAFFEAYEDAYFTDADAAFLAGHGLNLLRLPFGYRRFESDWEPGRYRERAFHVLDRAIDTCKRHGIYVLLDLHAVPGGQSEDWHADNAGIDAIFFEARDFQTRAVALWRTIAERYASEPAVFGYDLINEPNTAHHDRLNEYYRRAIAAIREVDRDHVIVVEGSRWSDDIDALSKDLFEDPLVMASFHHYPFFGVKEYPGEHEGKRVDRAALLATMDNKLRFDDRVARPMLLGEFGTNVSHTTAGPAVAADLRAVAAERGWHWTQWSYKDIGQMGLVSPSLDSPWRTFVAEQRARRAPSTEWRTIRRALHDEYADIPDEARRLTAKLFGRAYDRLALERAVLALKERFPEAERISELCRLAQSFRFDQCVANPPLLEALGLSQRGART